MYRLKSHLWPACTTCYLHKTLKSFVKYVRGRGDEVPGGAPGGRCPKCRTVTRRLQSGAHFGRCSLITFDYSSAKSKKMRTQKCVKSGKPVKYDLSRKVAMRPKKALFATSSNMRKIRHVRGSRRELQKNRKTRVFSKRKTEKTVPFESTSIVKDGVFRLRDPRKDTVFTRFGDAETGPRVFFGGPKARILLV